MKILVLIILLLIFFPTSSYAGDWSPSDTKREVAYLTLHIIDWAQTRDIARNPREGRKESNPILGPAPSVGEVNSYFMATGLGHLAISYLLPSNPRFMWQGFTITIEAFVIGHNYSAGVGFDF